MKMFYEKDANVNLIKEKKVAIFGYGSQGHAHALNLRDSGVKEVVVALREGSPSIKKAESKGLKVMSLSDAAAWADVVMMLTPDELQSTIYKNHIEQRMRQGTSLAFAHGLNIHFNLINSRKDLDVFMVAPKGPGHLVRSEYQRGGGVPCLMAIHKDSSGKARDLAMSYAKAFGGGAHFVMLGGMLAGHIESEIQAIDGKREFYGMSSDRAREIHGKRKDGYRGNEGRAVILPDRGPVQETIEDILGGVRSSCTYIGARRLKDIPKCASFVRCNQPLNTVFESYDNHS